MREMERDRSCRDVVVDKMSSMKEGGGRAEGSSVSGLEHSNGGPGLGAKDEIGLNVVLQFSKLEDASGLPGGSQW